MRHMRMHQYVCEQSYVNSTIKILKKKMRIRKIIVFGTSLTYKQYKQKKKTTCAYHRKYVTLMYALFYGVTHVGKQKNFFS